MFLFVPTMDYAISAIDRRLRYQMFKVVLSIPKGLGSEVCLGLLVMGDFFWRFHGSGYNSLGFGVTVNKYHCHYSHLERWER
jgi:hypothetical protein